MRIGSVEIPNNLILAPMAGVSDLPFRLLCREQGAGLAVMEMVSAKAILYRNKNTEELMRTTSEDHPVALQLFGSDPEIVSEIALQIEERPIDLIDFNMGCPVPKVVKNGEGSALMRDPQKAAAIVRACVRKLHKPMTVKIRKGFNEDEVNAPELAKRLEDAGAAAIAVHGRTREQYYSGRADWEIIRLVKEAVKIPVIGNGDVTGPESACAMMEQTGCDAVMIGRAARGNPWIFREILADPTFARVNAKQNPCGVADDRNIAQNPCGVADDRNIAQNPCGVADDRNIAQNPCGVVDDRNIAQNPCGVADDRNIAQNPDGLCADRSAAQRSGSGLSAARPSLKELKATILRHAQMVVDMDGEYTGIRKMRKHVAWYTTGYPNSSRLRGLSNTISTIDELRSLLELLQG